MFTQEFFVNNRKQLSERCSGALIIVAGNGLMQRTGDTHFSFRQDSNLWYLTGITEPNACLVINSKNGDEFIMLDKKTGAAKIFDGDYDADAIGDVSGISTVRDYETGLRYIRDNAIQSKVLYNDVASSSEVDFTLNSFRQSIKRKLRAKAIKIENIVPEIAKLRMIKQPQEIVAIQRAISATMVALQTTEDLIESATNEKDLLRAIDISFAQNSVVHAYEPIVAAGNNATTLHYVKNNASLQNNGVILFDVGAEFEGYAADISRTYIKGQNKRAAEIITAVKTIQAGIIAEIKPGATWKGLSELALALTANELIRLNVITDVKDAHQYFPHAFGHFLGLDVHDVGDYTQPLAENMVLTVEPGIYIAKEGIGVRIEDDILVTKTGAKLL